MKKFTYSDRLKKSNNQSECLKTAKHNCMLDILLIGSGTLIWVFCFELVSKSSFWPLPGASWPVSGSAVRRRGITPDPERKVGQDHLVDPRDLTKYSSGKKWNCLLWYEYNSRIFLFDIQALTIILNFGQLSSGQHAYLPLWRSDFESHIFSLKRCSKERK